MQIDRSTWSGYGRMSACMLAVMVVSGCGSLNIHGNYCGLGHPPEEEVGRAAESWRADYAEALDAYFGCPGPSTGDSCDAALALAAGRLREDPRLPVKAIHSLDTPWWDRFLTGVDGHRACLDDGRTSADECHQDLASLLAYAGSPSFRDFDLRPVDDLDRACREHDLCWANEAAARTRKQEKCDRKIIEYTRDIEPRSPSCEILVQDVADYFEEVHPTLTPEGKRWWKTPMALAHIRVGLLVGALIGKPRLLYPGKSDLCCDLRDSARAAKDPKTDSGDPCLPEVINLDHVGWVPKRRAEVRRIIGEIAEEHWDDFEGDWHTAYIEPKAESRVARRARARFLIPPEETVLFVLEESSGLSAYRKPHPERLQGWVLTDVQVYFSFKRKRIVSGEVPSPGTALIADTGQPGPENHTEEYPSVPVTELPHRVIRSVDKYSIDLGDGLERRTSLYPSLTEKVEAFFQALGDAVAHPPESERPATETGEDAQDDPPATGGSPTFSPSRLR